MSFSHLHPDARALLESSLDERLRYVRKDRFVEYSAAEAILRDLADVVTYPRVVRPPCRAVVADSNNGKTTLTEELVRRNPVVLDASGHPITRVVWAETPSEPDEGRLFSAILTSLNVVHRADAAPERLEVLVSDELAAQRTTTLVLDELHSMLNGSPRNQKQFMASLKRLSNTRNLAIIASGTLEVTRALATDPQFMTRFQRLSLPKWPPGPDFQRLLASFEQYIPLPKPSNLAMGELAKLVYLASARTIGSIRLVVQTAAELALRAGADRITFEILQTAAKQIEERKLNGPLSSNPD